MKTTEHTKTQLLVRESEKCTTDPYTLGGKSKFTENERIINGILLVFCIVLYPHAEDAASTPKCTSFFWYAKPRKYQRLLANGILRFRNCAPKSWERPKNYWTSDSKYHGLWLFAQVMLMNRFLQLPRDVQWLGWYWLLPVSKFILCSFENKASNWRPWHSPSWLAHIYIFTYIDCIGMNIYIYLFFFQSLHFLHSFHPVPGLGRGRALFPLSPALHRAHGT